MSSGTALAVLGAEAPGRFQFDRRPICQQVTQCSPTKNARAYAGYARRKDAYTTTPTQVRRRLTNLWVMFSRARRSGGQARGAGER